MTNGGYARYEPEGPCIDGVGTVHLGRTNESGTLEGVMFLLPEDGSGQLLEAAQIAVTITNGAGEKLLDRSLVISPINEGPQIRSLSRRRCDWSNRRFHVRRLWLSGG